MKLINIVQNSDRKIAAPLAGFPAIKLTNTTLTQNRFNAELQACSLYKLAEATLPDIMFTMMDLSVEAGALGLPVRYPQQESASVEAHLVNSIDDLEQFKAFDPLYDGRVWVMKETVRRLSNQLDVPVGAYTAAPFTLAGLMMGAQDIAMAAIEEPELVMAVLNFCEQVILSYAKALLHAGADVICLLDPTAAMLSPDMYNTFAGNSLHNVIRRLETRTILHICGDTTHLIDPMCATGVQALSLDSAVDLCEVAKRVPEDIVVMGNIDPVQIMRNGTTEDVRNAVQELAEKASGLNNIIFSTGCDLPPDTPIENITEFVKTVQNLR